MNLYTKSRIPINKAFIANNVNNNKKENDMISALVK